VRASVNAKAGFGEGAGKEFANRSVVFDDEQPHELSL
jgi:hypothetical protein